MIKQSDIKMIKSIFAAVSVFANKYNAASVSKDTEGGKVMGQVGEYILPAVQAFIEEYTKEEPFDHRDLEQIPIEPSNEVLPDATSEKANKDSTPASS